MTRERLARVALLAYPRGVRAARGEEMIGTLLDVSGHSRAAYGRELAALVGNGLRARSSPSAQPSAARVIADGLCYAGIAMLALITASLVGVSVRFPQTLSHSTQVWHLLLLGGCLSAALVGYDRIAAAGALASIAIVITGPYRGSAVAPLVVEALPVVCFAVMLIMPRYQARRARRIAWLVPIAALGALGHGMGPSSYLVLAPLAVAVPVALARIARDPRLAIACSLLGAEIAMAETAEALQGGQPFPIGLPLTVLLFSAAPLVIAFTARRSHAEHKGDAA
jgi:hypothetical protein